MSRWLLLARAFQRNSVMILSSYVDYRSRLWITWTQRCCGKSL